MANLRVKDAKNLAIGHYDGVTVISCGLSSFKSVEPYQPNNCFKWHKTIKEQKLTLNGIYGGRYSKQGEFPYTVLILIKEYGYETATCTGVLINEWWVLTAGHCLYTRRGNYRIYAGITDYPPDIDKNYVKTDKIIRHEKYLSIIFLHENDIGLIKLATKLNGNSETVNGICLPEPKFNILGNHPELAAFSGWGARHDYERSNTARLKTTLVRMNDSYSMDSEKIIVRDVSLGILCGGDSGGPLMQFVNNRAVLIGILTGTNSRNTSKICGPVYQMTFTSVPYHVNWINTTISKN